jgi:tetratricopeptide (TPR) repeat protein
MRRWYELAALVGVVAAGTIGWRIYIVSVDAQRRALEYECLTSKNADEQIAVCNKLMEHFAQSRALGYSEISFALWKKADFGGALAMADQAVAAEGEEASRWLRYSSRASLYSQVNDEPKAVADYSRAIELKPDNANLYFRRGQSRQRTGDHGGAIADLDVAITIGPAKAVHYQARAGSYGALRNWSAVVADWSRSIEMLPRDAEAYFHRGNAYAEMGDYEHAKKDFEQALALDPGFNRARNNLQRVDKLL